MMLPPERETPKPLRGGAVTIVDGVVMCPDSCGCPCHGWGVRDRVRCISCGTPRWTYYTGGRGPHRRRYDGVSK